MEYAAQPPVAVACPDSTFLQRVFLWRFVGLTLTGGEAEGRAAITGALALYLGFINLFLFLVRIFGQSR